MIITHKISLDLLRPEMPERICVKQGDIYSRALEILLFCDGEPFPLEEDVSPVLRWFACDPDTGESSGGICDTLPDGDPVFQVSGNQLTAILPPQMLALPGLVQADLVLVSPENTLASINFEFYVNPAAAEGTTPEAESFYKLVTLDQINKAITDLQKQLSTMAEGFASLEHEVFMLKQYVYGA